MGEPPPGKNRAQGEEHPRWLNGRILFGHADWGGYRKVLGKLPFPLVCVWFIYDIHNFCCLFLSWIPFISVTKLLRRILLLKRIKNSLLIGFWNWMCIMRLLLLRPITLVCFICFKRNFSYIIHLFCMGNWHINIPTDLLNAIIRYLIGQSVGHLGSLGVTKPLLQSFISTKIFFYFLNQAEI